MLIPNMPSGPAGIVGTATVLVTLLPWPPTRGIGTQVSAWPGLARATAREIPAMARVREFIRGDMEISQGKE
jgi:hypothetical protein